MISERDSEEMHLAHERWLREQVATPTLEPQTSPQNIATVYHFTPSTNWELIQAQGSLEPKSTPWTFTTLFNDQLRKKAESDRAFWDRKFIVGGIDLPNFDPWREYGLYEELLKFVSKGCPNLVLLSFPVQFIHEAYIREHAHESDKGYTEAFGEIRRLGYYTDARKITLIGRYYDSVVSTDRYDGSYKVPEIWIPHPIQLDDITVEKVGSIEDFG